MAPPSTIAVGDAFACAIDAEERVVCWGGGELDLGGEVYTPHPPTRVDGLIGIVEIALGGGDILCARNGAGHVECTRLRRCEPAQECESIAFPPRRVPRIANARALALGDGLGCAIVEGGEVRCWGRVPSELLDSPLEGDWTDAAVEVNAPRARSLAIFDDTLCTLAMDGALVCGDRSVGNISSDRARLLVFGGRLCVGAFETEWACAGNTGSLELGLRLVPDETQSSHHLPLPESGVEHAAVGDLMCARRSSGAVACSGDNAHGQLGSRPIASVAEPRAVEVPPSRAIAASSGTVCSVANDGSAACWGAREARPRLLEGAGELVDIAVADSSSALMARDREGRLLATDRRVAAIDAEGRVRVWTDLAEPPTILGIGDAEDVAFFGSAIAARRHNGEVVVWSDVSSAPTTHRTRARDIAGYQWLGCVLRRDRRLECWRANDGPVDPAPLMELRGVDEIASNGLGICARMGTRIYCRDMDGIERLLRSREPITGLAIGSDQRVCAIADHRALCSTADMLAPVPGTEGAEEVVVGYGFACVRTTEGAVRCWGNNAYGAIGVPHSSDSLVDIQL